jgi:hypothetical protein
VTEAATANDSLAQQRTTADAFTETPGASDSLSTAMTMPHVFTESVTAGYSSTDNLVPGGGGITYSDSFTESATASSSFTSAATFAEAFTETVAPAVVAGGPRKRRIGFCEAPGRCD